MSTLASIAWVDWVVLAVLLASVLLGLFRGLVFEVLSLLGWVAAYVAAQALSGVVAPSVPIGSPGSGLNAAAAFVAVFLVVLLVWGLIAWMISRLVKSSPLNPLDRVLGGLFGLLRGLLIALAVATVLDMTPLADAPAWRSSRSAPLLERTLSTLKPLLPETIRRHLRAAEAPLGSAA